MAHKHGEELGENSSDSSLKLDKELLLTIHGTEHEDILLTISEILRRFKGVFLSNHFHRVGLQFTGLMKIGINHMYLKPFISCLDSLTSYSVRFDTQILSLEQSQRINEQMRFEFEAWGPENAEFKIKFMQWLSRQRLVIESMQDSIKIDASGKPQMSSHVCVTTEYVVDENELQEDIYQLGKATGMTILLVNQDMADEEQFEGYQKVI